jgi:hypothetical protein
MEHKKLYIYNNVPFKEPFERDSIVFSMIRRVDETQSNHVLSIYVQKSTTTTITITITITTTRHTVES